MQHEKSYLILEDGSVFSGHSPVTQINTCYGEAVFNTGMTGYCESLTDPSYRGQILVFTYPLIGNYGVPNKSFWESSQIHARAVVISEDAHHWNHHAGVQSFLGWLHEQNIPWIRGVDTRAVTKQLRTKGVMLAAIDKTQKLSSSFYDPNKELLVREVSISKKKTYHNGVKRVVVVDCGMKQNILRSLTKFPLTIDHVPYDYDYTDEEYDGILLSNGPGNPEACQATIEILCRAMKKRKPIFGICLGAQLLALASGAKTYKLHYGHRGHNQPCMELATKKCFMTSQNHGYAIEEKSLPKEWKVSFRNLNDQSIEGITHLTDPFFAVQFHPEAAPGPTDTQWLFKKFYEAL